VSILNGDYPTSVKNFSGFKRLKTKIELMNHR